MKGVGIIVLVCMSQLAVGQLMLRNDFTIGKSFSLKNKGLSIVAVAFDRQGNFNLVNGSRGGRALVIDINALRHPKRFYTYQELATRMYAPISVYRPGAEQTVPIHLLMEPPMLRRQAYTYRYRTLRALR